MSVDAVPKKGFLCFSKKLDKKIILSKGNFYVLMTLLTKITAAYNAVSLSYHSMRGLYFSNFCVKYNFLSCVF